MNRGTAGMLGNNYKRKNSFSLLVDPLAAAHSLQL